MKAKDLTHRRATMGDLVMILKLVVEDELGQAREKLHTDLDQRYINAFNKIDVDQNQYLMVVEMDEEIVGTCHITMIPSLTFIGSTRMQIEAVRVLQKYRGQKIGQWMINAAIEYGKMHGASIVQLTTNKKRPIAKQFYESIGFEATHEGMKMFLDLKCD